VDPLINPVILVEESEELEEGTEDKKGKKDKKKKEDKKDENVKEIDENLPTSGIESLVLLLDDKI